MKRKTNSKQPSKGLFKVLQVKKNLFWKWGKKESGIKEESAVLVKNFRKEINGAGK